MKRFFLLFFIGILTIILILKYNIGIPCIFFELTHFYCPGCGMTRAVRALFLFDFYQAFRYNALIIFLPFLIFYFVYSFVFHKSIKLPNWFWYLFLVIVLLFGVLRNIPYFSFLAPIDI